jgi:hypothetical protein
LEKKRISEGEYQNYMDLNIEIYDKEMMEIEHIKEIMDRN